MTVLPILLHPNPHLKKTCNPIDTINAPIRTLADNMLETMYDAPGVGLAAPQIGVLYRLFVMDCADKDAAADPLILINPEIIWTSQTTNTYNEGCLSLPHLFDDITRPAEVKIRYQDINNKICERKFDGLWATCAQHELDHLNGTLFIDHLSRIKRTMMTKKMIKYKKDLERT